MEETSEGATEEESVFQNDQTCDITITIEMTSQILYLHEEGDDRGCQATFTPTDRSG